MRLLASVELSELAGCRNASISETKMSHAEDDCLNSLTLSRAAEKARLIAVRADIDGGNERLRISRTAHESVNTTQKPAIPRLW